MISADKDKIIFKNRKVNRPDIIIDSNSGKVDLEIYYRGLEGRELDLILDNLKIARNMSKAIQKEKESGGN